MLVINRIRKDSIGTKLECIDAVFKVVFSYFYSSKILQIKVSPKDGKKYPVRVDWDGKKEEFYIECTDLSFKAKNAEAATKLISRTAQFCMDIQKNLDEYKKLLG